MCFGLSVIHFGTDLPIDVTHPDQGEHLVDIGAYFLSKMLFKVGASRSGHIWGEQIINLLIVDL
jgi:hypothetical protein